MREWHRAIPVNIHVNHGEVHSIKRYPFLREAAIGASGYLRDTDVYKLKRRAVCSSLSLIIIDGCFNRAAIMRAFGVTVTSNNLM